MTETTVGRLVHVCPICDRDFGREAGLKVHLHVDHSVDDLVDSILDRLGGDSPREGRPERE
jgi:hypothetical protein